MILVTGATGNVGAHLVRRLAALGERPRALVRDPDRARRQLGDQAAELVRGDLADPATIGPALAGVHRVFLLTATSAAQFDQERNVIEAAAAAGVELVVKLSVVGAGESSPLHHGRWQGRADQALADSGVGYAILQLALFMQTLSGMVNNGMIFSSAGDGRVAMVDAQDVAGVAAAILTRPRAASARLTLTGPEALSFDDTARILTQATGTPVRHVRVTRAEVEGFLRAFQPEPWYAEDIGVFNDLIAAGSLATVTDTVQAVTGVPPRALAAFAVEHKAKFS